MALTERQREMIRRAHETGALHRKQFPSSSIGEGVLDRNGEPFIDEGSVYTNPQLSTETVQELRGLEADGYIQRFQTFPDEIVYVLSPKGKKQYEDIKAEDAKNKD